MSKSIDKLVWALALVFCVSASSVAVAADQGEGAKPKVIAHRGGKKWAPENTMAAFSKSIACGVDGIELDIHKCASGELVVIHDDRVDRTTNGRGLVGQMTWEQLKGLDCGSWYDKAFAAERLPLLQDVLILVDGKVMLNIEIKTCPVDYPGIDDDLLAMLDGYAYPQKIVISSFDHKVLRRIHDKLAKAGRPDRYRLAMLGDNLLEGLGAYAKTVGASAWNPSMDCIRKDSMDDARSAGLHVNVWTLNDRADWQRAREMGVSSIITDDPVGLKEFLGK